MEKKVITFDDVLASEEIKMYMRKGNQMLGELGYTEHYVAHAKKTAKVCSNILKKLGYTERQVELAKIAGYIHDIGNCINRTGHAQSSAMISLKVLSDMGMPSDEVAEVICAVGNHDENEGSAVSALAAALILADKSDVRRTRVRNKNDVATFDIHDRVNYATKMSDLVVDVKNKTVTLSLTIDTEISSVMEYFEIFMKRMALANKAATRLGLKFCMIINGAKIL